MTKLLNSYGLSCECYYGPIVKDNNEGKRMRKYMLMLLLLCLPNGLIAESNIQNRSKSAKGTEKISPKIVKLSKGEILRQRRQKRLKGLLTNTIKAPVILLRKKQSSMRKKEGFDSQEISLSEIEQKTIQDARSKKRVRELSLKRNKLTQNIIRKHEKKQARMDLLRKQIKAKQLKDRLAAIQKELREQQLTDASEAADNLKLGIQNSGLR